MNRSISLRSFSILSTIALLGLVLLHGSLSAQEAETMADVTAPSPQSATTEHGTILTLWLPTAPFPHESRAEGHTYRGQHYPASEHYCDSSVHVFIPTGWRPIEGRVDVVFYMHGWWNNVEKATKEFELHEQFLASGVNAIFVFPEGPKNAPDSGAGRLEEPEAFAHLMRDVLEWLHTFEKVDAEARFGRIVLSGHSGAYRGLQHIARHGGLAGNITDILLLDATYAGLEDFANWLAAEPASRRLRSVYTEHLAEDNLELAALLRARGVEPVMAEATTPESEIPPAEAPAFLLATTQRDHNQCVGLFGPWLAATTLPRRGVESVQSSE